MSLVRFVGCALALSLLCSVGASAGAASRSRGAARHTPSCSELPERIATIVIGNPLIADASLQAGGLMVITGKGYGMTNIIALDRAGNVLMNKNIEVRGPARARRHGLSRRRARDL